MSGHLRYDTPMNDRLHRELGLGSAIMLGLGAMVLIYYSLTNLAALRLTAEARLYPVVISVAGLLSCLALAAFVDPRAMIAGFVVLTLGLLGRMLFRTVGKG
jgi:hypothetical protein